MSYRRSMGAPVMENVAVGPLLGGIRTRARTGSCCDDCSCNCVGCCPDCAGVTGALGRMANGARRAASRMGLSGVTSQPRGPRVSLVAMGGTDVYTAATKFSEIPSGDPYRVPGHYCTGNDGSKMKFLADGNVASAGPDLVTLGLYALGGLVVLKVLKGKRRR